MLVLVLAASWLGGVLPGRHDDQRARQTAIAPRGDFLLDAVKPGDTAGYISDMERVVAARPDDDRSLANLGAAYAQRARETGDPSYYERAHEAFRRSLHAAPDNYPAVLGTAALDATLHRFPDALRRARQAERMAPGAAAPYGIAGDALVELGRYDEAFAAFDRMSSLRPSLGSYARVSYARELRGDRPGAIEAMQDAAEVGSSVPEHAAYTLVQIGNLQLAGNDLLAAEGSYRQALQRSPGYAQGFAGLAHVEGARGHVDRAVALYAQALDRVALPEFAIAESETLRAAGRTAEARKVDVLVDTMERLLVANGVRTEIETAMFDFNRGRDVPAALDRALQGYRTRRSIEAEDTVAWGYYVDHQCAKALPYSDRALRLGTLDGLKLFHRSRIEACLGHAVTARTYLRRAVAANPNFSPLYSSVARAELAGR